MKSKIAYLDDNMLNLECIKTVLQNDFDVEIFQNHELLKKTLTTESYACILLDIHMPKFDGFDVYEQVIENSQYNGCPILFISSDDSDESRIRSFTLGAVDFLSRKISNDEMIARVKSKIEFFQKHRNVIEFSSLRINLTLLKIYINAQEVALTFIELKILCQVLRTYPDFVSKADLAEQVWKTGQVMDATVYTHVSNLNAKLKKWDYEIQTLKNKGVQLVKKDLL